ncbi:MAG: hypothetical protein GEU83_21125 [Pseudonocardiaceae bacterium]|nr:hypothetical protein [Pseudonocardiaceae bacterium]
MAATMARVALGEGREVVVPQFLARPRFTEELQILADEVVLFEELNRAMARLAYRAVGPLSPTQRDAHELLERHGGA